MLIWLVAILLAAAYGIFSAYRNGPWSTASKHFKLYKVLVDPSRVPPDFLTVLKGDFPKKTVPGFVTYIPSRISTRFGLQGHQFVGCLTHHKRGFTAENFSANRAFKDKVHAIAAREISEAIRDRAGTLGTGEIALIDDRWTSPPEEAPDEHCIGIYRVKNGAIVSYAANSGFRFFSDLGPLELVDSIRKVLYAEIPRS